MLTCTCKCLTHCQSLQTLPKACPMLSLFPTAQQRMGTAWGSLQEQQGLPRDPSTLGSQASPASFFFQRGLF